jgi:polysaccharide biosynthesis transport protein
MSTAEHHQPNPRCPSGGPALLPREEIVVAGGPPAAVLRGEVQPLPKNAPPQFPSVWELLRGLCQCWLRAVTIGLLLGGGAAAAGWFFMPQQKLRARALIQVFQDAPGIVFTSREGQGEFLNFKKNQAALVKSRLVLTAALRQPKVAALAVVRHQYDAVQWLEEQLVVDYSVAPEIMSVSLSGDNEAELTEIVNAVATAYQDEIVNKEHNKRLEKLDQLRAIQRTYEEKLTAKRKTLRQLAEDAGANNPNNLAIKQRIALEQLAVTQKELAQLQSEVRKLAVDVTLDLDREKALAEAPVPELTLNEQIDKDLTVQAYLGRIKELEAQLEEIRRVNPTRFETVSRKTQDELGSVKKALEERRVAIRPAVEAKVREQARLDLKTKGAGQRQHLAYLKDLEKNLTEDAERLDRDCREKTKQGLDLEALHEEIALADNMQKKVASQAEALSVEREAPPRIQPLEEAVIIRPDQRKRQVLGAVGGGAGTWFLVVFAFSWWECRSLRINSAEEVVRGLGLNVVGTLPRIPTQKRRLGWGSGVAEDWESLLLESIDAIRTRLLHMARTDGLRVVMVTSAVGGEGKTSLSSHLATSLARAGRRTLLVDCDLRKPSLVQVFSLPATRGFSELLRGEAGLADVTQPTTIGGLSVIAAGECDGVALAALAQDEASRIFGQVRNEYDFIVIDSAPVLPVIDSLLIAQQADAVLFSVLRDTSRLVRLCAAYERLSVLGIRTLGVVMMGTHESELYGNDYRCLAYKMSPSTVEDQPAEES